MSWPHFQISADSVVGETSQMTLYDPLPNGEQIQPLRHVIPLRDGDQNDLASKILVHVN